MKPIRVLEALFVAGCLAGATAFFACQGSIGDLTGADNGASGGSGGPGGSGTVTPGSSSGSSSTSSSGGSGTPGKVLSGGLPPAPDATLAAESAGPLLMRRLTSTEYNDIVAHLLGDTTQPANQWTADPTTLSGYVAPTNVADLNVQLYFQSAQILVPNAIKNPTAAGNQLVVPPAGATMASQTAAATSFINSFGLLAYRRPVAAAELSDLLSIVFTPAITGGSTFSDAIGYVAQAMIQSPNFLYHWEIGPTAPTIDATSGLVALTPWQVASRLAMTLWADMPDAALLQAAQNNQLSTPAQISAQAARMYADPRAAQALYDLHLQWLLQVAGNITQLSETVKGSPLFTPAAAQALNGEFSEFLTSVYSPSGDGTLKTLLTAQYAYVNPDLAPIYGVTVKGTGFSKVQLDPTQRSGILTQLAFLNAQADVNQDNPVRRGLAVYVNLLCGAVNPPPDFVPSLPTTVIPGQTTRAKFLVHASSPCATGCHTIFDPPGFAFENYDAIGAYRTTDNGGVVDATGTMQTPGGCAAGDPCGSTISFKNAVDLVSQLSENTETAWCASRNWYRYASGRPETDSELGSLQLAYRAGEATAGFSLRDMLTSLVASKAFLYRTPSPGETLSTHL
jgi:Protein of unknown function (DUF1592)/Protein of unknown function (DUF1588)/Protein of unknown function (DUF1595)/Protein of unknown function (DUF1585)/Protein of unknown function (DUF1587)